MEIPLLFFMLNHTNPFLVKVKERKSVIPAANTGYLGISHVTLWQGFEPLKVM